ncbi:MAG: hypothetical protein K6G65_01295 [Lachnospiraceae bacterium]|nr:hypothetical protein [Lachnospiraceae bacterium]
MANRSQNKVVKMRHPFQISASSIFVLIIAIYMIVLTINYVTKKHISIYEVIETTISDDNRFKGFILRDETVYYADEAGYLNYYIGDSVRAAKNETIYSVDETGNYYDILSSVDEPENEDGSEEDKDTVQKDSPSGTVNDNMITIRNEIASFRENYSNSHFGNVKEYRYNIENAMMYASNEERLNTLRTILKEDNHKSLHTVKTEGSGIVSYTYDGNEGMSRDNIKKSLFTEATDDKQELRILDGKPCQKGAPVYKMINSEQWSVVIMLNESQYKKVKDLEYVRVRLSKINISMNAKIDLFEKDNTWFAELSMDKYLIHYAGDRHIDLELELGYAKGLKIPVSAILKKKVAIVPEDFVANTNGEPSVVKQYLDDSGEVKYDVIPVSVYKREEDTSSVCIYSDALKKGDTLIEQTSGKTCMYEEKTTKLEGVYNVNKGYAVFKVIEKLYENNEYAVVNSDTANGLSTYDHIVLNSETISESDIIND